MDTRDRLVDLLTKRHIKTAKALLAECSKGFSLDVLTDMIAAELAKEHERGCRLQAQIILGASFEELVKNWEIEKCDPLLLSEDQESMPHGST